MSYPSTERESERKSGVSAIYRTSAKDAVTEEIRNSIWRGSLKAGDRLREQKLAEQLNVSQTTVREALVDLEHLGFVQRVPPRKTFVTRLTRRDIDEIYAIRIPLENVAIDLLAAIKRPDLRAAESCYQGMLTASASSDRMRFESMDLNFHRALWEATGNGALVEILEKLVVKLFAFGFVMSRQIHTSRKSMEQQAGQHGTILSLVRAGDYEQAKKTMVISMDRTWLDDIDFSEGATGKAHG